MVNTADVASLLMRLHGEMESSAKVQAAGQRTFAASLNESLDDGRDVGLSVSADAMGKSVDGARAALGAGLPAATGVKMAKKESAAMTPMMTESAAIVSNRELVSAGKAADAGNAPTVCGTAKNSAGAGVFEEQPDVVVKAAETVAGSAEATVAPDATPSDTGAQIVRSAEAAAPGPVAAKTASGAEAAEIADVSQRTGKAARHASERESTKTAAKSSPKDKDTDLEQAVAGDGFAPATAVSAVPVIPVFTQPLASTEVPVSVPVVTGEVVADASGGVSGAGNGLILERSGAGAAVHSAAKSSGGGTASQGAGVAAAKDGEAHAYEHAQVTRGDGAAAERKSAHAAEGLIAAVQVHGSNAVGHTAERVATLSAISGNTAVTAIAGIVTAPATNDFVKTPAVGHGMVLSDSAAVTAAMNSASSSEPRLTSGFEHRTLEATSSTLEVGVPGGTHGWLKIRAELTETGGVRAALTPGSTAGVETLHRELPALQGFLEQERVPVSSVVVHAPASGFAAGADGGGLGRQAKGDQMGGQTQENRSVVDEAALQDVLGGFEPGDLLNNVSSIGGGWLSVRA